MKNSRRKYDKGWPYMNRKIERGDRGADIDCEGGLQGSKNKRNTGIVGHT